jgi:hypothetical protein
MADDRSTLPDARALSIIGLCLVLAPDEPSLVAWGAEHAEALKALDQPTLSAARAAYAARLAELRAKP